MVVIGNPLDLPRNKIRRDVLDLPGRDTPIDRSGFDPGALQNHRPGRNDRILADDRIIHHDSAHPDEYPVLDSTAMNDGIVTDRNIVAYDDLRLLISRMNHYPILDIHLVTDMDAPHVSPHDSVEPNAAVITDLHPANDSSIGRA